MLYPIATHSRAMCRRVGRRNRIETSLLTDIDREAHGAPAHHHVRRFLQARPEGLNRQRNIHRPIAGARANGCVAFTGTPILPAQLDTVVGERLVTSPPSSRRSRVARDT